MSWKPRSDTKKQWKRTQNSNQQNDGDSDNRRYNNDRWRRHQQYNQQNEQYYDSNYNQNQYHDESNYYQYNNKHNKNNNNYHYHSNYHENNRNNRDYHRYNNKNDNQYNRYNQYNRQYNNQYKNEYDVNNNYHNHDNNNNDDRYYNKKYEENKDIKYVKNTGRFEIEDIALNELESTLEWIWNKYFNLSLNIEYISKIIVLCGPPGSGKSTICKFVEKYYELNKVNNNEYILDVSTICSDVMKENKRKLIVAKIYEKLFKQILENKNKNKILIIDGFLRKEQHVYVAQFLRSHLKNINFIFLVINVDENTSIQRQLERGKKLKEKLLNNGGSGGNEEKEKEKEKNNDNNKKRIFLKDSDLYQYAARKRYQKYDYLLQTVRYKLKSQMKVEFDIIDATKSLQNVYENVQKQLEKQNKKKSHQ